MTLAVPPPVSPLQHQIARVFRRAMSSLEIPDGEVPEVAAGVVIALPGFARALAGLRALEALGVRLAALDARHQPVRWSEDSDVIVCSCGAGAYAFCPDRRLLDGESL